MNCEIEHQRGKVGRRGDAKTKKKRRTGRLTDWQNEARVFFLVCNAKMALGGGKGVSCFACLRREGRRLWAAPPCYYHRVVLFVVLPFLTLSLSFPPYFLPLPLSSFLFFLLSFLTPRKPFLHISSLPALVFVFPSKITTSLFFNFRHLTEKYQLEQETPHLSRPSP